MENIGFWFGLGITYGAIAITFVLVMRGADRGRVRADKTANNRSVEK